MSDFQRLPSGLLVPSPPPPEPPDMSAEEVARRQAAREIVARTSEYTTVGVLAFRCAVCGQHFHGSETWGGLMVGGDHVFVCRRCDAKREADAARCEEMCHKYDDRE
jgi:hypothetical protein